MALIGVATGTVATPNIDSTVAAAVEATINASTPTPTPDVFATIDAAVQATIDLRPTPTPSFTATPTFTPSPTPLPQPPTPTSTPPIPGNTVLQHTPKETLNLGFARLFQGTLTNLDSYWWAKDVEVTFRFLNAAGFCWKAFTTTPDLTVLQPNNAGDYQMRLYLIPSKNWPDTLVLPTYDYYEVTFSYQWAPPQEFRGRTQTSIPAPTPVSNSTC